MREIYIIIAIIEDKSYQGTGFVSFVVDIKL